MNPGIEEIERKIMWGYNHWVPTMPKELPNDNSAKAHTLGQVRTCDAFRNVIYLGILPVMSIAHTQCFMGSSVKTESSSF